MPLLDSKWPNFFLAAGTTGIYIAVDAAWVESDRLTLQFHSLDFRLCCPPLCSANPPFHLYQPTFFFSPTLLQRRKTFLTPQLEQFANTE